MPSASFSINGTTVPAAVSVAYGGAVTLALLSTTGVATISWRLAGSSASTLTNPTITPAGSPSGATATCTHVADPGGGVGASFLVECTVMGTDGETYLAYGIFGTANAVGNIPFASGEQYARHATHGYLDLLNRIALSPLSGGSITGDLAVSGTVTAGTGLVATTGGVTATAGGVTASAGNITASAGNLVATLGSVSAATTVTAGTGVTATTGGVTAAAGDITAATGNIVATAGAVSVGTTVTAGTGVTATTGGVTASAGNIVATLGNITASAGNIAATAGSVSAGTTVTGGTGVTATTGNVTASAGKVTAGTDVEATSGKFIAIATEPTLYHDANPVAKFRVGTGGTEPNQPNFSNIRGYGQTTDASTWTTIVSMSVTNNYTMVDGRAANLNTAAYLAIEGLAISSGMSGTIYYRGAGTAANIRITVSAGTMSLQVVGSAAATHGWIAQLTESGVVI